MRGKIVVAILVLGALLVPVALPYVEAVASLVDLSGRALPGRAWLPPSAKPVVRSALLIPTRDGPIEARMFAPEDATATAVVFPGIHAGGIDEPRLAGLCARLASTGLRVVCVPLPELRAFRVNGRSTDAIEDTALWIAQQPTMTPDGRIAIVGVSFAGGLAIVAGGRPALRGRVSAILSLGGHGDLGRTLRYLTDGRLPDGSVRAPHDYGLAVGALAAAPLLLGSATVNGFQDGVRTFLDASMDASPDHAVGQTLLADARAQAATLPTAERAVLQAIIDRDVRLVGRWIEPAIGSLSADPGLSPERSPLPEARVFLLHGRDDNVIPSSETVLLARHVADRGHPSVRWLLTPVVTHADLSGGVSWRDAWALVAFWKDLRAAIGA